MRLIERDKEIPLPQKSLRLKVRKVFNWISIARKVITITVKNVEAFDTAFWI